MNKQVSQESALLTGAIAIGGLLATYAPMVKSMIDAKRDASAAGKAIEVAKDLIGNSTAPKDLVRFTQSARVEPILLMDNRALTTPFIQDVVHTMYNMFTGYWLLAISLDTKINNVSIGRRLDKFATDRDLLEAGKSMAIGNMISTESLTSFGMPFVKEILEERVSMEAGGLDDETLDQITAVVLEAMKEHNANKKTRAERIAEAKAKVSGIKDQKLKDKLTQDILNMEKEVGVKAYEMAQQVVEQWRKDYQENHSMGVKNAAQYVEKVTNLGVGNVIDVTISEDGKQAVVPVTIRLRVASMPSSVMTQTLAVGGKDVTFGSRYRAWRAREIKFWSDFVLQMDRVDAHRAAMMKDETGYYKTVYARDQSNKLVSAILKDGPSISTASAILVLDSKTATELERKINGRLEDFKTRQAIFGHTFSMLMAVVDPDWESVTIYTRGIDMPTKLTARDIRTAGKSDSKELMDILKSYSLGKAPGRF
jgi:hypothetical protein